jgi:hypothetical protein
MPLTSTRPVTVYLLDDADDREQLAQDLAPAGWRVAVITSPGTPLVREVSVQQMVPPNPTPIVAPFTDVIVSDLVLVQAMTRAAYNTAHPDNPLPLLED